MSCIRASYFVVLAIVVDSVLHGQICRAADISVKEDTSTGWKVYTLSAGETKAVLVPDAGANVQSVVHQGNEYFHQPENLSQLPGVRCGNPILYPTPNRIKGGKFEFQGQTYVFREGPGNHIHGLVNAAKFHVESTWVEPDYASATCAIRFAPGTTHGDTFPWEHTFRMKVTVREGVVRWDYEVDNDASGRDLPFGVALHPYIKYQNSREETFLTVPATSLMESVQQLPTGKLLDLAGNPLDAREPVSLEGYNSDDVFFGMTPDKPAIVEFRETKRSISFKASKEFTHLVVWTPGRPFMGIENQTCSTDAHNLSSQGKGDVAHLQICGPGEKRTGWVEYHLK